MNRDHNIGYKTDSCLKAPGADWTRPSNSHLIHTEVKVIITLKLT